MPVRYRQPSATLVAMSLRVPLWDSLVSATS